MRLIESAAEHFVFELSPAERRWLVRLLKLYPRIPPGYQRLSRKAEAAQADQQLLDEALAALRQQHRERIQIWLNESGRWSQRNESWRLTVAAADIEWLLQVWNDIRVGCWLRLGSPGPDKRIKLISDPANFTDLVAMEFAGHFEASLLEALNGDE